MAKRLATGILLAFVIVSVAALVVKSLRPTGAGDVRSELAAPAPSSPSEGATTATLPAARAEATTGSAARPQAGLVVYYFHGTKRCASCNFIEETTRETLERRFKDALEGGRIELRVLNFDLPENERFKKDFNLFANSLVLVSIREGRTERWEDRKSVV